MPAAAQWGAQGAPGAHSDVPQPSEDREELNTEETRDLVQQLQVPPRSGYFRQPVLTATCLSNFFFPKGFCSTMDEIPALPCEANQLKVEQGIEVSMQNTYFMAFPSTGTIA